jgi:serine/threonine protein phosphatase 1
MKVKSVLKRFRGDASTPQTVAEPRPEGRTYVVGDVHGCLAALDTLLAGIDTDRRRTGGEDAQIVFVGDYIDRGQQSAETLQRVRDLEAALPDQVVCLLGSHEKMLLDFLDKPRTHGLRWLRNGGIGTLTAYRIDGLTEVATPEELEVAAAQLRPRLAEGLIDWLRARPLRHDSGNVTVAHAGLDPEKPHTEQRDNVLLWGNAKSLTHGRPDGRWVVHGHTVVTEPEICGTRINIDTGAWVHGSLTAVVLDPAAEPRFLQTFD